MSLVQKRLLYLNYLTWPAFVLIASHLRPATLEQKPTDSSSPLAWSSLYSFRKAAAPATAFKLLSRSVFSPFLSESKCMLANLKLLSRFASCFVTLDLQASSYLSLTRSSRCLVGPPRFVAWQPNLHSNHSHLQIFAFGLLRFSKITPVPAPVHVVELSQLHTLLFTFSAL